MVRAVFLEARWSGLLHGRGKVIQIRRHRVLLDLDLKLYVCFCLPHVLFVSLFLPVYFSVSYQQTIRKTSPRQRDSSACEVHQCHLSQTFEISLCGHTYRSFTLKGVLFCLTCVSFWGSESECVYQSSPFLCHSPSQGRKRVWQWGIKSRYPRYPHQRTCYYFIRLRSGCVTLPSFSSAHPSVAEFLISAKTMPCLSCRTK